MKILHKSSQILLRPPKFVNVMGDKTSAALSHKYIVNIDLYKPKQRFFI